MNFSGIVQGFLQSILIQVLIAVALAVPITSLVWDEVESRFIPKPIAWTDDSHFHPESGEYHKTVKHRSREGHWLIIECVLPEQRVDVHVQLVTPIHVVSGYQGHVQVTYRIGEGEHLTSQWGFRATESYVTAPSDLRLAQRITRTPSFSFWGRFDEGGPSYAARFEFDYRTNIHPAIQVLRACGQGSMPEDAMPPASPTTPTAAEASATMIWA